jgi:CheY-like chemotaxis protein
MGKTVLVVDDDPIIQRLIAAAVNRSGWSSVLCENGHQAFEYLDHSTVDLITLDIMMPDMTGVDFLEKLILHEHGYKIPVVVITALDQVPELERLQLDRTVTFLRKPFTIPALQSTLKNHFGE